MNWEEDPEKNQNWIDKIVTMIYVKEEIAQWDYLGLWSHHLPEVAATEMQLAAVEAHLGHKLDASYKDFLRCSNGWRGFYQTVDLFGTGDLLGSSLMNHTMEMLRVLDDAFPLEYTGFSIAELLPIAATRFDEDIFVLTHPTSQQPGIVIWLAGEEVDRFPSFEEFFLAMLDYNRQEINNLKEDKEKGVLLS